MEPRPAVPLHPLLDRHWSSSEIKGCAHMRQLQDTAYDTVDDLDTRGMATLQDFYEAVLGPAMRQSNVCGMLVTGVRDMTSGQNSCMAWGMESLAFPEYDEVWQVRSTPKGRLGKPIEPGEIRKVAVLVRPSRTNGKASRITTIKLWIVSPIDPLTVSNQRQNATYGAHGVNMMGIHLFEHHGRSMIAKQGYTQGRHNYRVVYGSFVSAMATPPSGMVVPDAFLDKKGRMIASVQACPIHHLVIASSLYGNTLQSQPGGAELPGTRELCGTLLEEKRIDAAVTMGDLMIIAEHARRKAVRNSEGVSTERATMEELRVPEETQDAMRAQAYALMASAEVLCEQLSHCGFLDMSADPFFEQAMPDAMHRPCGMPMLIAFAVRIACYPERVGLPPGKVDDQLAAREAANLLESLQGAVLPHGTSDDKNPHYAMDIAIQHTVTKLLTELERIKAAAPHSVLPQTLRDKGVTKIADIELRVNQALNMFYRTGIALCVDLLGTTPKRPDGTSGVYTRMGLAESCCDPVELAKTDAAYCNNLGQLCPRINPMRCTSRGAQQMALARTLLVVERWLCLGTYCGTRLVVNDDPDTEIERVSVHSSASSALSRCFSPASDEESKPDTSGQNKPIAEAMIGALESAVAVRNAGGSKKKMRRTMRQDAQRVAEVTNKVGLMKLQEEEAVQKRMSSRSRQRANFDAQMVNEALDSLAKKHRSNSALEEAVRGLAPGSGKAIDDATAIFSEVLQCGACHGTTERIDFQCFLVGMGSTNHCCNCNKPVHVVETLAFGGHHAACRKCRHPRCLDCVQHDIDLLGEGKHLISTGPLSDAVAYRSIENCLFCSSSSS